MKVLTKYYGNMQLEVYRIGTRYRFILKKKNGEAIYKPREYEVSLPICLLKVENWLMDNHSVHAT